MPVQNSRCVVSKAPRIFQLYVNHLKFIVPCFTPHTELLIPIVLIARLFARLLITIPMNATWSKHGTATQPTSKVQTTHTSTHSPEGQTRTSAQRERRLSCTVQFAGFATMPSGSIRNARWKAACRLWASLKPTKATRDAAIATMLLVNRRPHWVSAGKHWLPTGAMTKLNNGSEIIPVSHVRVSAVRSANLNILTVPNQQ